MDQQLKQHRQNNSQKIQNPRSNHQNHDENGIKENGQEIQIQGQQNEERINEREDIDEEKEGSIDEQKQRELQDQMNEANNNILQLPQIPQQPLSSNQKVLNNKPAASHIKQEKNKKKKVRQFIQDFSPFLPESILILNKTIVPALIRVGSRYQVQLPKNPPFQKMYQSMQQLLVWDGNNSPHKLPKEEHLQRFKQLLGENRTQEQLIHIRQRLKSTSWKQVLQYVNKNKSQLRRIFHMSQRNRF